MNLRLISSVVPVLVFYAVHRVGPPWAAILAGFVASGAVYWYSRQVKVIGFLAALGFVIVSLSAVIGLVSQSETAYLAADPIGDFLFAGVYIGSIFVGHPLIGAISRELVPTIAGRLPAGHSVFIKLSVLWAVYNCGQGLARTFMLRELSVGEYLIWSRVTNMPVSALLILVTSLAIYRAVVRHAAENGEPPPPTIKEYLGLVEPAPATAAEASE